MKYKEIILICLLIWNFAVFLVYAADKIKARKRQRRIPESVLLLLAFAGGGAGALPGMYLIRHKTQHLKFKILVPLALLLQLAIAVFGFSYLL